MSWMVQIFMIALVGTTIMLFGNKFLSSIASVNLNGSNVDDIEGTVTGKLTQGAGLAMGLAAGGVGAAAAGGSVLKGAAMGGMSGARGGKPATSALLGLASGRASGTREQARKRQEAEQAEHNARMEIDPVYRAQYNARQERNDEASRVREDAVMAQSTEADADRWIRWSKEDWDSNKGKRGKVVGRQPSRPVPEPTDPRLREILAENGVEFRPRMDQMEQEVARVTESGMTNAVESPVLASALSQNVRNAMEEAFANPQQFGWPPAPTGSPLWTPGQDAASAAATASLLLPDGSVVQPSQDASLQVPQVRTSDIRMPMNVEDESVPMTMLPTSGAEVESAVAMSAAAAEVRKAAQDLGKQGREGPGPVRPIIIRNKGIDRDED